MKRTIPVAKQEARPYSGLATQDVYAADDDIKLVIAVEVTYRDGMWAGPDSQTGCRRETAVAPIKEDAHVPGVSVGHCQVRLAITVEVTHGHGSGRAPHRVVLR